MQQVSDAEKAVLRTGSLDAELATLKADIRLREQVGLRGRCMSAECCACIVLSRNRHRRCTSRVYLRSPTCVAVAHRFAFGQDLSRTSRSLSNLQQVLDQFQAEKSAMVAYLGLVASYVPQLFCF